MVFTASLYALNTSQASRYYEHVTIRVYIPDKGITFDVDIMAALTMAESTPHMRHRLAALRYPLGQQFDFLKPFQE